MQTSLSAVEVENALLNQKPGQQSKISDRSKKIQRLIFRASTGTILWQVLVAGCTVVLKTEVLQVVKKLKM